MESIALVPLGSAQGAVRSGTAAMFFVQPISDAPLSVFAPAAGRIYVVERAAQAGNSSFRVTAIRAKGG